MFNYLFFVSILLVINPITFVADRNYYAQEGGKAYKKQAYQLASQHYERLVTDLEWRQDHVRLNLAHSCFLAKKYELATTHYTLTAQSKDNILASTALNQLGYLASLNQDFEQALRYFQEAISRYVQNKEARYNYELIAKILQTKGGKSKKNNEKQPKKTAKQENSNQSQEKINPQKLKDLQLNKEKAEAILKAIRNQEAQHIQQQQQKKKATQQQNPNLPDW